MPTLHRFALGASTLALAVLVGCGGGEPAAMARVKAALTAHDTNSAKIELKNFLQKHPQSAEARFLFAQQLALGGEFAAAVPEFQRALDYGHPRHAVLPPLAQAMIRTGDLGRVVSMFKNEELADPEAMASLSASVAMAMAMQGDINGAAQLVDHVLTTAPKSAPARLMKARLEAATGRVKEGMQILDGVLAEQPTDAEAWATKGDFMLRMPGGQQASADAFGKALALNASDVYSLTALVSVRLTLGDVDEARKALTQLKKVAPQQFVTVRSEASVAYATGDHARAREIFQSLLRAAPTNVQLLLLAGENEIRLGAATQAEAMFAKASALDPGNAVARRLLGQAQLQLGQPPKALLTLAPLVEAQNASAEVLATAAEARLLNGETKAADALYARLAKLKPTDPRLRTIVATSAFGRSSDDAVFSELREISTKDKGSSADMALIAAHMQRGQADAALEALTALDRKLPAEPRRHVLRGQILSSKKDWGSARQAFEAALAMDGNYMPALTALSALDARDNKPERATKRFQALLKAQPNNAAAMLALAELTETEGGSQTEVLKLKNAAVKAAPNDLNARLSLINHHLARHDFEPALAAAQSAVASIPDNLELLELLGRCQIGKNQTSQALATFGKIINLTPKSPQGHALTAAVHLREGDDEAARRSIERALQLAPDHPETLTQAITLALRQRQPERALEIARSAQQLRPGDALGWTLEGEIEFSRGNWMPAAAAYRKAIDKKNPGTAPRKLYATLVRANKAADASAFASQWLKSQPKDADFVYFMGDVAQAKGQLAAAGNLFAKALELSPEHVLALNNLAMLRLQAKQPGALELAQRAARIAPHEAAVLDTLALAQASENRLSDAIATQRRAVQLAPDTPEMRLTLAKLLLESGEKANAKEELDKLKRLGQGFKQHDEVSRMLNAMGRG